MAVVFIQNNASRTICSYLLMLVDRQPYKRCRVTRNQQSVSNLFSPVIEFVTDNQRQSFVGLIPLLDNTKKFGNISAFYP